MTTSVTNNFSFPKNKINVLLLENIHAEAELFFKNEGYNVISKKEALSESELINAISDIHILGIRSKTELTENVIKSANKLLAIGAFCIGTNQINIKACDQKGIAVFNAPYSNTRSVVELALGEMILLLRNITTKTEELHRGVWNKSAANSFEVRGKTLGIIGYGHIGSQLSILAENLGMKVLFFDLDDKMPLGNAIACKQIDEVLASADVVTIHIDGRESNFHFMDKEKFSKMKTGSIFLNLSRGHVVDYAALKLCLETKQIIGAGIDVYPEEPATNSNDFIFAIQGIDNVILTPHIGGSTEEAQEAIGKFVPNKIVNYINIGSTDGVVNLPQVQLPIQNNQHRILHIHKNTAGMLAKINQIIALHQVNISGQYLKTNEYLGYVIIDIENKYPEAFIDELKALEHTIKCRILF
jgi:D-3-phosphoglycerate dehydrogenase / 2-oxoglutarate reductase